MKSKIKTKFLTQKNQLNNTKSFVVGNRFCDIYSY